MCQKTRRFLDKHNIPYTFRDIKDDRPTRDELVKWIAASGIPIGSFFNTRGDAYRELELKDKLPQMSDEEMIDLLATDGMLVKRPIMLSGDQVLVGVQEDEYLKLK